ncbi:hypothetical protein L1987_48718 [Smallanthus sonchifolius]|uniref:Uncharacterized protein n=1 Tax=Smallanthus sonchifolius TaxID=185202 RepID=A0ACB9FS37_9ASTR|nr:hypothetical protein L1987_48718 [Smallanthus sonchifolius]
MVSGSYTCVPDASHQHDPDVLDANSTVLDALCLLFEVSQRPSHRPKRLNQKRASDPDACAREKAGQSIFVAKGVDVQAVDFPSFYHYNNFHVCVSIILYLKIEGNMKSALAPKGKSKAPSSSTARAKNSRQQLEMEQIPKPNCRKTEILQVVNFDSKAENLYQYLPEGQIYKQTQGEEASQELKEFQPGSSNKERKDLNILPKLCAVIGGHNIIPRTSDKGTVRVYELRVLAVLVAG